MRSVVFGYVELNIEGVACTSLAGVRGHFRRAHPSYDLKYTRRGCNKYLLTPCRPLDTI